MDRLFEAQSEKIATEKQETAPKPPEKKSQKLDLRRKAAQEKNFEFEEQTFLVEEESLKEQAQKGAAKPQNAYLQSFENKTIEDFKKEDAQRQAAELNVLERQKESLSEFDPNMTISQFQQQTKLQSDNKAEEESAQQGQVVLQETASEEKPFQDTKESTKVIEKPNYDFLQEPKKTIKLSKKQEPKKKRFSKKTAGVALACALAGSAVICVGNAVLIDQMSSSYFQIDETYKFNLGKYLKSLNNLDTTKKSMEFLETYPDDLLEAGDLGEKSNWFDKFCNYLGGLFGG